MSAETKEFKIKWGMVIDIDKCTGCGACMVACQAENNVAPAAVGGNKLRSLNWLTVFRLSNRKPFPDHEVAYLPRPCMQCGKPSCVAVCPVIATDKREEGGIVSREIPMYASKVMLVCPKCGKATRHAVKVEGGAKVRVCKKCGQNI